MISAVSGIKSGVPSNISRECNAKRRKVSLDEVRESNKNAYINKLDQHVQGKVFSYLGPSDLGAVCQSDKTRNEIVNTR